MPVGDAAMGEASWEETQAMTTDDAMIQRFLNADGSLRQMPSRRGPRFLILAHIARRIPVAVEPPEAAVNEAQRPVSTDVAMLRRPYPSTMG